MVHVHDWVSSCLPLSLYVFSTLLHVARGAVTYDDADSNMVYSVDWKRETDAEARVIYNMMDLSRVYRGTFHQNVGTREGTYWWVQLNFTGQSVSHVNGSDKRRCSPSSVSPAILGTSIEVYCIVPDTSFVQGVIQLDTVQQGPGFYKPAITPDTPRQPVFYYDYLLYAAYGLEPGPHQVRVLSGQTNSIFLVRTLPFHPHNASEMFLTHRYRSVR